MPFGDDRHSLRPYSWPMKVLIFGGTGLIGSALAQRLAETGVDVGTVSRHPPSAEVATGHVYFCADIRAADTTRNTVETFRPDVIVHLAAMLQQDCDNDPAGAADSNVTGLVNVLEAARDNDVARVVFASSIAVYGERRDLMREDDPLSGSVSLYGESKRMGETLGQSYAQRYGLEFVSLRYSGVFGPGTVLGAGLALARQRLMETAHGKVADLDFVSGNETIQMTHMNDAVGATQAAIEHEKPGYPVYNVAGPQANHMSLKDFYGVVRTLVPEAAEAQFSGSARTAGPVDLSRLTDDLGFKPSVTVEDGLRQTIV